MTWMTTEEYAEHVRTNKGQVTALCKKGVITAIKIGVGWKVAVEKADEELLALRTKSVRKYDKLTSLSVAEQSYKKSIGV